MLKIISLLGLGLIISCASISKKDCEMGEWEMIGEKDGLKGLDNQKVLSYVKDCKDHNVIVDKKRYFNGMSKGLDIYCQKSGRGHGQNGKVNSRPGACIENKEKYEIGLKDGLKSYCVNSRALSDGESGVVFEESVCPTSMRASLQNNFEKGLRLYCRPGKAFELGRNSSTRPNFSLCPESFRDSYQAGVDYAEVVKSMSSLRADIGALRADSYAEGITRDQRDDILDRIIDKESRLETLMRRKIMLEGRFRDFL